ncbi:MAG: hypothetical protein IPG61_15925, partial [bacterium]|nr:hypothetical protein [bacterium]
MTRRSCWRPPAAHEDGAFGARLVEVQTSDQPGKPELNVTPRRLELAQQGLTAAT